MAGFEVIIYGRIWVIAKDKQAFRAKVPHLPIISVNSKSPFAPFYWT